MIIAAKSSTDKPLILTYNKSTGVYGAKADYNFEKEEIVYHQFVDNTRAYKELTDTEVTNLDTGKYVIVSEQGTNNNKRTLVNYTVVGEDYFYSTALKKEATNYYLAEDPEENNKKIEPILWTITRN